MATATAVPSTLTLEEYLHTAYHPDVDFVDDHIEERNMGETLHSLLQAELTIWFGRHRREWNIRVLPELRTLVGEQRVRIPDVTVALADKAILEQVRVTPALLAIEILSPEDRISRVIVRLKDYLEMGVENVWLMDPQDRVAYSFTQQGLRLVTESELFLPDSPVFINLPELFAALDN